MWNPHHRKKFYSVFKKFFFEALLTGLAGMFVIHLDRLRYSTQNDIPVPVRICPNLNNSIPEMPEPNTKTYLWKSYLPFKCLCLSIARTFMAALRTWNISIFHMTKIASWRTKHMRGSCPYCECRMPHICKALELMHVEESIHTIAPGHLNSESQPVNIRHEIHLYIPWIQPSLKCKTRAACMLHWVGFILCKTHEN